MSTLKQDLNFGDWIINTKNKNIDNVLSPFFVISVDNHNVWVYKMGEKTPNTIPIRIINMTYSKVDPKTIKVLYGDRGIEINSRQINIVE